MVDIAKEGSMQRLVRTSIALLLISFVLAPVAASSDECIRCQIANELRQLIVAQITSHELSIDPEADSILNQLVDHAARELESVQFADAKVIEARDNAKKLGTEIAAQTRGSEQSLKPSAVWRAASGRVVTKTHVLAALCKICPLYPFCKKKPC
jgi:hypothetical protein